MIEDLEGGGGFSVESSALTRAEVELELKCKSLTLSKVIQASRAPGVVVNEGWETAISDTTQHLEAGSAL